MKYIKYLVIIFIILLNVNVYASCDTKELSRLKEKANEIQFSYKLVEGTDRNGELYITFDVTASNLDPELRALIIEDYYLDDYREFKYNDTKETTLHYFSPGDKVQVTIKAYVKNDCSGTTILTKNVNIPYYNYFYNSDLCKENPDFDYCKVKVSDKKITNADFINKYYDAEEEESDKEISTVSDINYKALMIVAVVIIVAIIIVVIVVNYEKK